MRRCKGTFDIIFGAEHRMRKEEMEEKLNKEAKQVSRCAARITDVKAGSDDRKHTSGEVFVAVGSNLGAVIGKKKEGAVKEEEESLEAEIPTVEMNPKNPMSREEHEHEDYGHAFAGVGVLLVSKVVVLGDIFKLNRWR